MSDVAQLKRLLLDLALQVKEKEGSTEPLTDVAFRVIFTEALDRSLGIQADAGRLMGMSERMVSYWKRRLKLKGAVDRKEPRIRDGRSFRVDRGRAETCRLTHLQL